MYDHFLLYVPNFDDQNLPVFKGQKISEFSALIFPSVKGKRSRPRHIPSQDLSSHLESSEVGDYEAATINTMEGNRNNSIEEWVAYLSPH